MPKILMAYNEGNALGFSAAMRFALKGQHKTALWNPFRVRVRMVSQPGAAFIRIRGFSCPRLICASLSGSIKASIKYNSFVVRARPRTSFREEPLILPPHPSLLPRGKRAKFENQMRGRGDNRKKIHCIPISDRVKYSQLITVAAGVTTGRDDESASLRAAAML